MGKTNFSENNKVKVLFSDTLAFTISNFASKILVFLLLPLYTAVLSTKEYGIADLITNTINVLYPILTLSIMEATLRFAFEKNINKNEVLTNSLFIVFLSEAFILLITPIVNIFNNKISDYWLWFAIIYFGFNLQQVLSQYLKGIGKSKIFAVSGVVQTAVVLTSNIICLLLLKIGLTGYLLSIALGYYLNCFYMIFAGKIRIAKISINIGLLKKMLNFSIPTIPVIISWWISTSADKYIIIAFNGIAASGIYSVAYKIPSILTMFTSIFNSAWTLSAIRNIDDEDNAVFHTKIYRYFNAVNVLACSVLILSSKWLAKILFSKQFFEAWHYVPFLLIAYVFSGLAGFLASSFRAAKSTKDLFVSTSIGSAVNIILNFYFIKNFGNMGAAFTTLLGFAVTFYIRSYNIKKIISIKINVFKDSLIYLLLFFEACLIAFEFKYGICISVMITLMFVICFINEIKQLFIKFFKFLKTTLKIGDRK